MKATTRVTGVAAAICMVAAMGCGGGSSGTPTSPTSPGGNNGGGGTISTTTMTINAAGVLTPNDITVAVGSRVTIVNNHNRTHEMHSDPHPEHTDCPAINDVGFLSAGQSKQTGNLNVARTCGIHDHNDPGNSNLMGRIRIQ
jgi:plastocyanin